MLSDYNLDLRQKNSPEINPIKKLGTLQIGIVESISSIIVSPGYIMLYPVPKINYNLQNY